ncbi:MAG: TIM barrel protein, partial [Planctomycetaceae bacterium]
MRRRQFLAVVAAGAGIVQNPARSLSGDVCQKSGLLVAPHLDMFRHASGDSLTQQIAFMHACGFRAVDDNRLASRDADAQAEIGQAARRHGIAVGQFAGSVSFGESLFASGRSRDWRQVLGDLNRATGVGRRAGARYCTVVPGLADPSLNWNRQFHNARQLLDECSQLCASAGMTLLLESFRHPSPRRRMLIEDVHTACRVCQSLTRSTCRAVLDTCCQRLQPIH